MCALNGGQHRRRGDAARARAGGFGISFLGVGKGCKGSPPHHGDVGLADRRRGGSLEKPTSWHGGVGKAERACPVGLGHRGWCREGCQGDSLEEVMESGKGAPQL
eukprot:CAMPEP_0118997506 /NCGR_PEP_ID=MMETSP1173-20130426/61865_1 /TAXON_ID=1034831 /ORGANISM="Rhizochromulina marina cf, Strain CCMP1243" /LENGTH=104 /DNA_ID=CAMNT_0006948959 /DNA_START=26 /DNA_END=336 /DNA_ORIENTATION=+